MLINYNPNLSFSPDFEQIERISEEKKKEKVRYDIDKFYSLYK